MKLAELKGVLNQHPDTRLRFVLPDGASVPAHAHVTEVARIDKRFIDCGGTLRNESLCRLQTWFSDDTDHRLLAGKLARILDKADLILGTGDLEVDIEHQAGYISQFPLKSVEVLLDEIVLHLIERRTACLAEEKCKPPKRLDLAAFNLRAFDPRAQQQSCCGEDEGCCQ
jgi:hypothetical protein